MPNNDNLSNEKVTYFKNRLLEMKEETLAKVTKCDGPGPNESVDELADYDNHPADMGTEQFEQERDAGLDNMFRDQLQEIDDALARIENGTYGLSEKSEKPIPEERLEAEPTARYLVEEE
jgi:RNA polymerase-binding transcription factor DksA